jgi:hypothetical protein
MKYDAQLAEVQKILPSAQSILVALPAEPTVDELAAGLSLFLSLEQLGKNVAISTEGIIRVGHTNLFGVGEIHSKLPEIGKGNLIITLGGVVTTNDKGESVVPALEKIDYYPTGTDFNLVFRVLPGQKFEPQSINPHRETTGFDLIFVLGSSDLEKLGGLYTQHRDVFANSHVVNIDNEENSRFGNSNLVEPNAASVSEMIPAVLFLLQVPFDGDIATNILSGIYEATNNLQSGKVGADTFEAVAESLRAGGKKPGVTQEEPVKTENPQPQQPVSQPTPEPVISTNQGFDFSKFIQPLSDKDTIFNAPVPTPAPEPQPEIQPEPQAEPEQSSEEERPMGEQAISREEEVTPGDDWLTPKIFKGSNIG